MSRGHIYKKSELSYGLTFSKKQAQNLGLDWKKTYLEILENLGAKKIRLPAYWDEIESNSGQYSFKDLDWQINEAGRYDANIILAVGGRLPRWPECHFPEWAQGLGQTERETKILSYIAKTVEHYRDKPQITAWQIENEPFLTHFGECPKLDKNFLDREISLVKSLDSRPIIITDSGELSFWIPAAKRADIFGTTMYRDTYSRFLKTYVHYPITPGFFRFKKNLARIFAHPKDWIVIELEAEPWGPIPYQSMTDAEKSRTMDLTKFRDIIKFSSQTGFKEFYLWGAEWWYWEKTVKNNPVMWEEARKLFE
ncbi:MAG: cellulase family glycosylhydrolase [Patescibacteria group bacterium]|nr:cellulase family glycosylhydrolase [Patescibacteria group bacterium]